MGQQNGKPTAPKANVQPQAEVPLAKKTSQQLYDALHIAQMEYHRVAKIWKDKAYKLEAYKRLEEAENEVKNAKVRRKYALSNYVDESEALDEHDAVLDAKLAYVKIRDEIYRRVRR